VVVATVVVAVVVEIMAPAAIATQEVALLGQSDAIMTCNAAWCLGSSSYSGSNDGGGNGNGGGNKQQWW